MSQKNSNICILVPFHNEEKYLYDVVKELKKTEYPIFFVDDGSTDRSRVAVLDEVVYSYYPKQGKGFAIKYAATKLIKLGYDYILTFDADKQHTINDIPTFVEAFECLGSFFTGIYIGNRYHRGKPQTQSKLRYIGNTIISYLVSKIAKRDIRDTQCGMRLYHKSVFDIDTVTNGYDYETEILIRAAKKGFQIANVPVECIYIKGRTDGLHIPTFILSLIKLYFTLRKT